MRTGSSSRPWMAKGPKVIGFDWAGVPLPPGDKKVDSLPACPGHSFCHWCTTAMWLSCGWICSHGRCCIGHGSLGNGVVMGHPYDAPAIASCLCCAIVCGGVGIQPTPLDRGAQIVTQQRRQDEGCEVLLRLRNEGPVVGLHGSVHRQLGAVCPFHKSMQLWLMMSLCANCDPNKLLRVFCDVVLIFVFVFQRVGWLRFETSLFRCMYHNRLHWPLVLTCFTGIASFAPCSI